MSSSQSINWIMKLVADFTNVFTKIGISKMPMYQHFISIDCPLRISAILIEYSNNCPANKSAIAFEIMLLIYTNVL